jgi:hypothetical protein
MILFIPRSMQELSQTRVLYYSHDFKGKIILAPLSPLTVVAGTREVKKKDKTNERTVAGC